MQQTFEFYKVDPITWKNISKIDNIKSCSISRDLDSSTLGSASIEANNSIEECYVRVFLVTIQNKIQEKHPLGTFLVQSPSVIFDGKSSKVSIDAYTPLIELKEKKPPIGFFIPKESKILERAYLLTRENVRVPVVEPNNTANSKKNKTDFVSDGSETWLEYLSDYLLNGNYTYQFDELSRILFSPKQEAAALQPKWVYDNENSILHPEITTSHDIYGVPNVVEVIYSNGPSYYYSKVVNNDPSSPISTISRGREIVYRETNPSFPGAASQDDIDEYAKNLLRSLSTVEYEITYTHAYTPTTIGDCVLLNYPTAGLDNVKAKIKSQTIKCEPGCPVSETSVFTQNLWR